MKSATSSFPIQPSPPPHSDAISFVSGRAEFQKYGQPGAAPGVDIFKNVSPEIEAFLVS